MCVFGGCESFGGCKSGMNLPPNPINYYNSTTNFQNTDKYNEWLQHAYNEWLQHAATDVNAKKHHLKRDKKEHPSWWLSQADIDKFDPKPLTRWQRFWAWWRK